METSLINWEKPQRQPVSGLVLVFIKTFWELIKRVWPVVFIVMFGGKENRGDKYEIIGLAILGLVLVGSILNFIFFRFYIINNELVVKKGWLKKVTIAVPLQKIQAVHIEATPMHNLLGIVRLTIDTAGSSKAEVTIDALKRPMAEMLRRTVDTTTGHEYKNADEVAEIRTPLISLDGYDLLKLSISANHVETFFILLSFGFGIYENLRDINEEIVDGAGRMVPGNSVLVLSSFATFILLVTVVVSTARIFFKFYDFSIFRTNNGIHIKTGLTNVREQFVPDRKVQYVSWGANWIRKLMKLWMLEYHIAGADDLKKEHRVQIPVTQDKYFEPLINAYHPAPEVDPSKGLRIDSSFILRRFVSTGLIPSLVLIPFAWLLWEQNALWILLFPLIIGVASWLHWRKFRIWITDDVVFIKKGLLGHDNVILRWRNIQHVQMMRTFIQRRRGLASVSLHTASGTINVFHIPLSYAHLLMNFALYQVESKKEDWM